MLDAASSPNPPLDGHAWFIPSKRFDQVPPLLADYVAQARLVRADVLLFTDE